MTNRCATRLLFAVLLSAMAERCMAQQIGSTFQCSTTYENHNQVDYGPLKVNAVEGASVIQVGTEKQPGVPGSCYVLFTEKDHRLVAGVEARCP